MNKSKFLKRSLAALLAILMVAAMIPLSAAAAGDTVVVDINDDEGNLLNRDTITVTQGKLSGADGAYTVTLPYNEYDTRITVATDRKDVDVYSVDAEGKETLVPSAGVAVTGVPNGGSKTATVVLRSQTADLDADPVATYEFTVSVPTASGSTVVTGATYTYDMNATAKTVTGTVNGNTITFAKLPWGHVDSLDSIDTTNDYNKVSLTLADPTTGSENTFGATAVSVDGGKATVPVTAQNGNQAGYNLVFTEEDCLTGLTIDGNEATLKAGTTDTYEITLSAAPAQNTTLVAKTPKRASLVQVTFGKAPAPTAPATTPAEDSPVEVVNGKIGTIKPISDGDSVDLVLTEKNADGTLTANTKTYHVIVNIAKNADPSVKSFTVNDGTTYTETGVVAANGDMTAVLANGTTFPKDGCELKITPKGNITAISVNGATSGAGYVTRAASDAEVTLSGVSLSATNTIAITAEDGTTKTYKLSLSADPNKTTKPYIDEATLKTSTKSYTGEVNKTAKTITFNIPAADTAEATYINTNYPKYAEVDGASSADANFALTYKMSAHTKVAADTPYTVTGGEKAADLTAGAVLGALVEKNSDGTLKVITAYDYFDTPKYYAITTAYAAADGGNPAVDPAAAGNAIARTNKVKITSDGGEETYTIVFHQNTAEAGKRLTGFKFYNAAKQDKVTDENTYTAKIVESAKTVTVEKKLPYGTVNSDANTGAGDSIAIEFEVSTGASLWYAASETATLTKITDSGWNDNGNPKFTIPAETLTNAKVLVVADEALTAGSGVGGVSTAISSSNKWSDTAVKDSGHAAKYTLDVQGESASEATDILSLEEVDGQVVSFIDVENGTVEVVVPETYVTEGSEKEFDLTITTAPLVSLVEVRDADGTPIPNAAPNTDNVIEMLKVVANDDGTYSLMSGTSAIKSIAVTAENDKFKKIYTVTVSAKTLSSDNSLSGVTVKGEAATEGEDNAWTVELPYGTDLDELTADDVVAAVADEAEAAVVKNEDGTYTITVKAENGQTAEYTLTVTVADEPVDPDNPFTDIGDPDDPANWSAKSIITAAQNGWILGMGNGQFNPKGQMSRAQFALIIARIKAGGNDAWEEIAGDYTTDVYTDVSASNSYMNAIAYVTAEGIMGGKGAGKFDPNGTITRQEAAKVMAVAAGLEQIPGNTVYADDASIAGWAKPFVNAVTENNIMNGGGSGFNPNQKLTREMGATILVRAFAE